MKFVGNNQEIIKLIPEAVQKAWPDTTVLLDGPYSAPADTDKKKCIAIVDKLDPKTVMSTLHGTGIFQIVQLGSPEFAREIVAAATMMEKPLTFLDDPVGVILQTYEQGAGGVGAPPKETKEAAINRRFKYNFNSSYEKKAALDSLKNYVEKVPRSRTIQNDVLVIADELYTNAVFNAPNKKDQEVSRTVAVHLEGKRPPNVFAYFNDDRLLLGVEDPCGSLLLERIIDRIKVCYDKGVTPAIRMGTGGAGIGSFMVFELATSYYACVDEGVRTIVCATLPLGVSGRTKESMLKNIHLFYKKKK